MFDKKPLSVINRLLLALLAFVVIISILLTLFITSPSFLKAAAVYAGRLTGMRIDIGSVSIPDMHRIVIENLNVEKKEDRFSLAVPHAEVEFTLYGLLRKNIEGIIVRDPKLSITIKKESKGPTSLPFTFNALSLSGADVTIYYEDSEPLHISPVNLTLIRQPDGKYGDLRGNAFISGLDATAALDSEIEMKTFDFKKIHADVSPIDLGAASAKYPLSLMKLKQLKGTCTFKVAMEREVTGKEKSMSWHAEAALDGLAVHKGPAGVELREKPLKLSGKGRYITESDLVSIDSFAADLADMNILKLQGTIEQMRSDAPDLSINAKVAVPIKMIKAILHSPIPVWLSEADSDGTVSGDIAVSGNYASPQISGNATVQGRIFSLGNTILRSFSVILPFEYTEGSMLIKKAFIRAGNISNESTGVKNGIGFRADGLKLDIASLSYKNSLFLAEDIHLHAGSTVLLRDGKEYFAEKDILITGDMDGDINRDLFNVKNVLISAGFFKGLAASADISTGEPFKINASLAYNFADLKEVSRAFPHNIFTEKGYAISGKGALKMTGSLFIPENSASTISGSAGLEITDAGFSSSDGSLVCEGIRMRASSKFESSLPDGPVAFSADAEAGGFELLAGKFYGSFKERPLAFSASGTYNAKSDTLRINNSKAGLQGIGEIVMSGLISDISKAPYFDASVHVGDISNSETYDFFVRETFQEQFPILSDLDISGSSSLDLDFKGSKENFTAVGNLQVEDMSISAGTKDSYISGVQVSLPVDIAYPEPLHKEEAKKIGIMTIKDMFWSALKLNDIRLSPSLWQNDIILKEDVRIPLYGGEVVLKDISYGSIFADEKKMLLSVDIKDLDLEKASVALKLPKFRGSLSGSIPRARFQNNTLFTEGEMEIELFGGKMRLNDLSADNVFSPAPSLKAGIKFDDIDLGRLTAVFDFGHISGVMRGEISELVIVNGQAEHFRASVETYKKKGVEQKISVEALKKISILGTGTSTSILDRGIYQLFKEYGYEKIGFSAYLKNDNLLLVGIGEGGDRKYLVKGSFLPPKVNVINYNQNISFKEMSSRLKRITAGDK